MALQVEEERVREAIIFDCDDDFEQLMHDKEWAIVNIQVCVCTRVRVMSRNGVMRLLVLLLPATVLVSSMVAATSVGY